MGDNGTSLQTVSNIDHCLADVLSSLAVSALGFAVIFV